ncbi:hypothetical protein QTL97_08390 [Sporosarcina thermotolerans]|uniref:Uncharacterized protein n=2 Tax=Sporosarcina thermotolerans TaxID=633404 RepID=A0AAW9AAF8_9BACL|nr:hypothetical protein [Sporosarcina thermotolerans]MDW0116950.1 hypothetical protein [Sporosarcina thermotolerans]WHT47933.1 hypothetical protein QNH10_17965 [Sporosarcina thermotolerans]
MTFANATVADVEQFMREKDFTGYDIEFVVNHWDNNNTAALERLNYRLIRIEYEKAREDFITANDFFFYNQIYLSDDVEQIADELREKLHDLWVNYDLDIGSSISLEKNERLIQQIDLKRNELKITMREELKSI